MNQNKAVVSLGAILIISMLINVFHPFLWGPDEPRVAEISREVYVNGNFITPHLCNRPFVEKPPLYFDMVACMFHLTGGASAGVARLVSAILGLIMLGATFFCAYKWKGTRCAVIATLMLITMPQFYRAAHWILLDIGVGAFCALALVLFAYHVFWIKNQKYQWPVYLFYLMSAGAFLSKGIIGIFHIGVIIGAYILICRRWDLLKRFIITPAVLVFIIPVATWIYMFYLEGGMIYLQEHFINNTVGRFLHISIKSKANHLAFTDVGNKCPWYFYLKRLPEMFGGGMAFLVFIFWDGLKKIKLLPEKWTKEAQGSKLETDNVKSSILRFLLVFVNGKTSREDTSNKSREIIIYLLLWSFLPVFLLSFSSIKEVTYILPSYAAIAIMIGGWMDERLPESDNNSRDIYTFIIIIIPLIILNIVLPSSSPKAFLIVSIIWLSVSIAIALVFAIIKLNLSRIVLIALAGALGGIIIGNTPEIMRKTGLRRKCFIDLAGYVWKKVGNNKLYIYGCGETMRGAMPFYGKRITPAVAGFEELEDIVSVGAGSYVIMVKNVYERLSKKHPDFFSKCKIEQPPFPGLKEDYVLVATP